MKQHKLFKERPFKRMSLLPNVSNFEVIPTNFSLIALLFGVPKHYNQYIVQKMYSERYNRYLERQFTRLSLYARKGELKKFLFLSSVLIRKSEVFKTLAMNRTMKNWVLFDMSKLDRIWRRLEFITRTQSWSLRSKRVWIDKKEGDYARPLGVPTEEWRIYSWMHLEVIERWLYERDLLQPWQHGGRGGKGVKSCITDFVLKMDKFDYIYEFDIKGFYDNISQEAIALKIGEIFGNNKSMWITKLFGVQPMNYILPPKEKDKAFAVFEEVRNQPFEDDWGVLTPTPEDYGFKMVSDDYREMTDYFDEFGQLKPGIDPSILDEVISFQEADEWEESIAQATPAKELKKEYKNLMDSPETFTLRVGNSENARYGIKIPTEEDRALGRDSWKGLGQEGRGVPQGLGISPLISTLMTDIYFSDIRGEMLMYMDDGLIFGETRETIENAINDVKNSLSQLGLELAESKSKFVKEAGSWVSGCKFLGLYYDGVKRQMSSMTRSGTCKPFKNVLTMDQRYAELVAESVGETVSNVWRTYRACKELTNYEAGVAYNFLGYLIADAQYKGGLTREQMKFKVQQGKAERWKIIQECKNAFIWNATRQGGDKADRLILQTISSVACEAFLRMDKSKIRSYGKEFPKGNEKK